MAGDGPAPGTPRRWRLFAHALDRTGPPMLVLAFVRWVRANHPDDALEVIAFRGGALEADLGALVPVTVVLDPEEPWDHRSWHHPRAEALRARLAGVGPVDANLLVSVSASHSLKLLPDDLGPVVTWSVEIGEDLRWLDEYDDLDARTDRWLAGSEATRSELIERLGARVDPPVAPEFVEDHPAFDDRAVADARRALGAEPGQVLVVGAGIGTERKGLDLFLEVAQGCRRQGLDDVRLGWIGGERDPLHPLVAAEADRLGLDTLRLVPSVPDIARWFAAADLFVHPARVDAFPLVALHAVLAGAPVIGFAGCGGLAEMLGPGFVGVPYPDVDVLVGEIASLSDRSARAEVLERQQAWVTPRFVASAAAPRLYEQLEAVARGRTASR